VCGYDWVLIYAETKSGVSEAAADGGPEMQLIGVAAEATCTGVEYSFYLANE
jgi:hypothetical protein